MNYKLPQTIIHHDIPRNASTKGFGIKRNRAVAKTRFASLLQGALHLGNERHGSRNTSRSFGIIEALISGMIVITVISASLSLRQRTSGQAAFNRHQGVAYMLAEEGIEAIRHIRDTNYLTTQKDGTKLNWDCGFVKKLTLDTTTSPYTITCDTTINIFGTANAGDFLAQQPGGPYNTMELGNGMQMGNIFGGELLPSWHLSLPNSFDGGTAAGKAQGTSVSSNSNNASMGADKCLGIERIFVREGSISPTDLTGGSILVNRRSPDPLNGRDDRTAQDNYQSSGNCAEPPPAGYAEYRRQIIVGTAPLVSAGAGNLPRNWSPDEHITRVLVRVNWREQSKTLGTEENAVLLATYLTDWRPSN